MIHPDDVDQKMDADTVDDVSDVSDVSDVGEVKNVSDSPTLETTEPPAADKARPVFTSDDKREAYSGNFANSTYETYDVEKAVGEEKCRKALADCHLHDLQKARSERQRIYLNRALRRMSDEELEAEIAKKSK